MADALVVAVFDEERAAWDAVVAASEHAAQGHGGIHDACLVVRAPDGTVRMRETKHITPSKAGWYGGAWGLLGGAILGFPLAVAAAGAGVAAIAARRHDAGVTNEFEQAVAERLEPGKSAAVLVVEAELSGRVEAAARDRGAWAKTVTLADAQAIAPPR
jgi:uncharacterized membrane protein